MEYGSGDRHEPQRAGHHEREAMTKTVSVLWKCGPREGVIDATGGRIVAVRIAQGEGQANGSRFRFLSSGECRLTATIADIHEGPGAGATVVSVREKQDSFSFWLRDVGSAYPIYLVEYGVVVLDESDTRSFEGVGEAVRSRGTLSALQRMQLEPEEGFAAAASETRDMPGVTWLGLSRDIRIFEVGFRHETIRGGGRDTWDWIRPRLHGFPVTLPELNGSPVRLDLFPGRGLGCVHGLRKWLEEGSLPILNAEHRDGEICYAMKYFVTLGQSRLEQNSIRGTHFLVADRYSQYSMLTERQKTESERLLPEELSRGEQPVLYLHVDAINTGMAPRYSWMRIPCPGNESGVHGASLQTEYDAHHGYGQFGADRVYLVASLNGEPVPQREMAVLLAPGESVEYLFLIPHQPVSRATADQLRSTNWREKLDECIRFWRSKAAGSARVSLPEPRIEQMIKAGRHHLDLVCYGREPDDAVAPVIGVYCPIGSESSPILQFLDSIGETDLARRGIEYFFRKQHDDGFMQNFGGYMLETGAVLWNVGEHFRYTRDATWVAGISDGILKAVAYLSQWRKANQREDLRGRGYGLLDGKVADPEDPYHSFMLNGYAYLGLLRAAEVLREIHPEESRRIEEEARALLADIRASLQESFARGPVVPLGNGAWCPSVAPWAEARGPLSLHVDDGDWFSHAAASLRDTLLGPIHLLIQEVVRPDEPYADFLLNGFSELFYLKNVAFSQPYYSTHPWAHLQRREVKAFLKEFYNGVSSLADRQTYSFWEHYHHASPHKTHEEAWFLMRCRWMLYLEAGDCLRLLPGVPRAWLQNGECIEVDGMRSYFGRLTMRLESEVSRGEMKLHVELASHGSALPRTIEVRVPHPEGARATAVSDGRYDSATETVAMSGFEGSKDLKVFF
jgi:hypothetical protein